MVQNVLKEMLLPQTELRKDWKDLMLDTIIAKVPKRGWKKVITKHEASRHTHTQYSNTPCAQKLWLCSVFLFWINKFFFNLHEQNVADILE